MAFSIRIIGAKPGYNKFHSDEGISYSAAVSMIKNGNLDPLRYDYPAVVPLTNYVFYKTVFIPLWWSKYYITHLPQILDGVVKLFPSPEETRRIFQLEILGEREINAMFWGRYVTVIISTGSVFLLYLLAKNLFNPTVGLISAFLLAVNFRAVLNSHIGLPDSYNAFFLILSLLLSYRIVKNTSKLAYLFAGIGMGLSFATKYQFFSIFPFAIAHIWSLYLKKERNIKHIILNPLISGLILCLVFVIVNPYIIIHFEEAYDWVTSVSLKYAMGRKEFMTYPLSYFYNVDFGPSLFLGSLVGIGYALIRKTKQALFVLGFVFPFLFMTLYFSIGGFYVRNFVTISPLLILFAAVLVEDIYKIIFVKLNLNKHKSTLIISYLFLVSVIFAFSYHTLLNTYIHTKYFNTKWTYDLFPEVSDKYISNGDIIASHGFDPLPGSKKITRVEFESDRSYSLAEFREQGANLAVINMDWAGNQFYGWMNTAYPKSLNYWNKPVNLMKESYWGVTISEMINHTITAVYKPWQAPDAALYLIDVPKYDLKKVTTIENYNFSEGFVNWQVINPEKSDINIYSFDDSEGYIGKGSVKTNTGVTPFSTVRISSPNLSVTENTIYYVTAYVKSTAEIKINQRNIFMRLDYFVDDQSSEPLASNVSSRYWGKDWKQIEIQSIAPKNATYARVSIQLSGNSGLNYWVDDITIKKSDESVPSKSYQNIPFNEYKDLLYPYSHGNL